MNTFIFWWAIFSTVTIFITVVMSSYEVHLRNPKKKVDKKITGLGIIAICLIWWLVYIMCFDDYGYTVRFPHQEPPAKWLLLK